MIWVSLTDLPLPSVPMTSLGYVTSYGIFSRLCVLLQRAEISTDSLTKGHVNGAKQLRDVSPTFLKGSPGAAWATSTWSEWGLGFSLWPHCCSEVITIPFLGEPTDSNDKSGLWCQVTLASCPGPPTFYLIALRVVQNLSTFVSAMKSRQYVYRTRSL